MSKMIKDKVANEMTCKLVEEFDPVHIELINESHMHSVPENSETHFKLLLVSDDFSGVIRVQRQQKVFQVLDPWLKEGPVHALSMRVLTSDEWKKTGEMPASPDCRGGSKLNK